MEERFSIKMVFYILNPIIGVCVAAVLDLGWWSFFAGPLMAMASLEMMYEGAETECECITASIISLIFSPICEVFSLYLFYYTGLFIRFIYGIIELLGLQGFVGVLLIVPVILILIILGLIS